MVEYASNLLGLSDIEVYFKPKTFFHFEEVSAIFNDKIYYIIFNEDWMEKALPEEVALTEIPNDLTTAELSLAQTIRDLNIYLYKGYVYDQETGLYYCHTRYYNPNVGRWISIDDVSYLDPESIGGMNLYAYCGNNPVMCTDPSGHEWYHWILAGVAVVGLTALAVGLTFLTGGTATLGFAIAIGALKWSAIGFGVGAGLGFIGGYAITGSLDGALDGMGYLAFAGAVIGAIYGGINGGLTYMRSTVVVNGQRVPVYRGGNSVQLKGNEFKILSNGTQRGLSVNTNPAQVQNFGGAYRVTNVPRGLQIVQQGSNLNHYEIIAKSVISQGKMQMLLNKIVLILV